MANIKTVNAQEDFLVQQNGDYNVPFDEVSVTVADAVAAGTILETAGAVADGDSASVFGILAQDKPAGTAYARVMTRGNPTTVNAQALPNYLPAMKALLADLDIVVVND